MAFAKIKVLPFLLVVHGENGHRLFFFPKEQSTYVLPMQAFGRNQNMGYRTLTIHMDR